MELELTPEQIAQSVSAAYDSVAIINELKPKKKKSDEEIDRLTRNEEHIRIMMNKEWFVNSLTNKQIIDFQNL